MSLRIVGGALSGRRFPGPPSDLTRPTAERVREALASRLDARGALDDAVVLDLFAGTGALAFEALSRGAARAVLVERDRRVRAALRGAIAALGLGDRARPVGADLARRPEAAVARIAEADPGPFTLVLADPPYAVAEALPPLVAALDAAGRLADAVHVAFEHAARTTPPAALGPGLEIDVSSRYGDSAVTLYARDARPEGAAPTEPETR